jgi:hypothetical protein
MSTFLYLSVFPESLVASMLPPLEFGSYFAVGTKKQSRGQAIFFEVNPDFSSAYFPLADIEQRCLPHADGQPKRSVYLSIYRALEHIPLANLRDLYLVTDTGQVLQLKKEAYEPEDNRKLHLYQELCPVTPRIATLFKPQEFCRFVTNLSYPVSVPKIFFVELLLEEFAFDPLLAQADNLPYPDIDHLRDCLMGLQMHPEKPTKTVRRYLQRSILIQAIKNGFFVGDQNEFYFYPFPSHEELGKHHAAWWKSAQASGTGVF